MAGEETPAEPARPTDPSRRKTGVRRIMVGALAALVGLITGLGAWTAAQPRVAREVWASSLDCPAGSPAAVVDSLLSALTAGDHLGVAALLSEVPGFSEEEIERIVRLQSRLGLGRHAVVRQEVWDDTDPSGLRLAQVWGVAASRWAGDFVLEVCLALEPDGAWRIRSLAGYRPRDGQVGPPDFGVAPEALVPLAAPARPSEDTTHSALTSAMAWESVWGEGSVPVVLCPQMELAFLVAGLTGQAPEFCSTSSTLGGDALRHFRACRDHPAVQAMAELTRRSFRYDAVPKLALCFGDPDALEPVFPLDDYLCGRSYGPDRRSRERRLLEAVELMRRFSEECDFLSWFESKRGEYEALVSSVMSRVPPGIPAALEKYFGQSFAGGYAVIISALSGNYAAYIDAGDGQWIFCIVHARPRDTQSLWGLVVHEWSHGFVNPVTAAHSNLVDRYRHLFPPLEAAMRRQAYGSWATTLNEHIVRAVEARLALHWYGQEAAEEILARNESLGFAHIRTLYDRLAVYEGKRGAYPTYADFFPELLQALGNPGDEPEGG